MNRKMRKRLTLRQGQHKWLLTLVIATGANSAAAETHLNPFFNAPTGVAPALPPQQDLRKSKPTAGSEPLALGTINFDVANQLAIEGESDPDPVADSAPDVATGHAGPTVHHRASRIAVPRRVPVPRRLAARNSSVPSRVAGPTGVERSSVDVVGTNAASIASTDPTNQKPANQKQPNRNGVVDSADRQWLQSVTEASCSARAAKFLDDAYREYSVAAWASAEASAWMSLELTATGIDIATRKGASQRSDLTAKQRLQLGRTAIREAMDFVASGAAVDADRMHSIASSHQTPALGPTIPSGLKPTEAVDKYLDFARVTLVPLAAQRVEAAQAMDLLAAIQLGRDEAGSLPEETALCLRRAALQGQPSNASLASRLGMQLADMGLDNEAQWTLRHAMTLSPTMSPTSDVGQALARVLYRLGDRKAAMELTAGLPRQASTQGTTSRVPEVIELSPAQFASISPAFNQAAAGSPARSSTNVLPQPTQSQPAPLASGVSDTASRRDRSVPSKFAGFRLPFSRGQIDDAAVAPTFADDAEAADTRPGISTAGYSASDSGGRPSFGKRLLSRFPKLW